MNRRFRIPCGTKVSQIHSQKGEPKKLKDSHEGQRKEERKRALFLLK